MFNYSSDREQSEILEGWWRRYRFRCLAILLIFLSCIYYYQSWQTKQSANKVAAASMFSNLIVSSKLDSAKKIIMNYPNSPYSDLTNLWLAKQDCLNKSWSVAINKYDGIIKTSKVTALVMVAHWLKAHALLELKDFSAALNELDLMNVEPDVINEFRADIHSIMGNDNLAYSTYAAAYTASKDPKARSRIINKQQNLFLKP